MAIYLAGVIRFELMMTISKTVALGQLGETPTEKQDTFYSALPIVLFTTAF
jgi:hypothetical protein